jgi:hypothetical protein
LAFVRAATSTHRQDINAYIYYIHVDLHHCWVGGEGRAEKRGACRNFQKNNFLFDEESFGKFLCKSNIPTLIN